MKKNVPLQFGLFLTFTAICLSSCANTKKDGDSTGGRKEGANEWSTLSPDGLLAATITLNDMGELHYTVSLGETSVVESSTLGFSLEEDNLSQMLTFENASTESKVGSYHNTSGKNEAVSYAYRQTNLTFRGTSYFLDVSMRAYDDGFAFNYGIRSIDGSAGSVAVTSEETEFALPSSSLTWVQTYVSNLPSNETDKTEHFSYEEKYSRKKSDSLYGKTLAMPALYRAGQSDVYALLSEAKLIGSGYYGSMLKEEAEHEGEGVLHTVHNPAGAADPDNEISLPFTSPWRVGAVGSLKTVVESEIVEKVYDDVSYWKPDNYDALPASSKKAYDYDWVETGLVAWNWLSYNGVKAQDDWDLQREYVDLAAKMGWKYVILDGGWDQTASKVKEFTAYASERNVKVIVWCDAYATFAYGTSVSLLSKQLATWKSWGIDGIKIDFFDGQTNRGVLSHQGEDIQTIKWYESIYQECAKQEMVVVVHGCNKPTGERRVYPNVISREAIYGNELWPSLGDITVNSMFTRAIVGPTDFTPLVLPKKSKMTMGHQMALAVLYECGAPCMADKSENYTDQIKSFYSAIPSSRDETLFLCGELDGYYCGAVRVGDEWFVAGINASGEARSANVDYSFLSAGEYEADYYLDIEGKPSSIASSSGTLTSSSSETFSMYENGGFAIHIKKK